MSERTQLVPVETLSTNHVMPKGHAGTQPLPVARFDGGYASAWVIPRKILKLMLREEMVLSLVVTDDGSVSMSAVQIQAVKSQ